MKINLLNLTNVTATPAALIGAALIAIYKNIEDTVSFLFVSFIFILFVKFIEQVIWEHNMDKYKHLL